MQLFYSKSGKKKLFACSLLFTCFILLSSGKLAAQNKDSTVTGIYTDFQAFWKTSTTNVNTVLPDSSHNLLAFTYRGQTYSTGVNNAVLDTKLGSANYIKEVYKA